MNFSTKDLQDAVRNNIISKVQLNQIEALKDNNANSNKFVTLLYYMGALIIISAMTWLMAEQWSRFGHEGVFILTLAYILVFLTVAILLWRYKDLKVPSGLLFSIVICIVPLMMYSLLSYFALWDTNNNYSDFYIWIKGKWVILELSAILVGFGIFYFVRFPFLLAPISFALWFLSMDIVPIILRDTYFTWTERAHVSIVFGIFILLAGYGIHRKFRGNYAFWLYLFGLLTTLCGLSVFDNDNAWGFVLLFLCNGIFFVVSLILEQKVFIVFGTIGFAQLLFRVSYEYFIDSALFPFILTAIGVVLISSGIAFQKNSRHITEYFQRILPSAMFNIKPHREQD